LQLGASWLNTGAGDYKAYGVDLALKLFGGNILPEIRAEWVRNYRDMANLPNRGNLYFVGADVFKTDRITLVASWTDTTSGFSLHSVAIYNPFFLTPAEALFRRPVAFGAVDNDGNVLLDKVFDVRLDIKLFGERPLFVHWFNGDVVGGSKVGKFGSTYTVGFRGWKLADKLALDILYGNKSSGDVGVRQQYLGVAATASF